MSYILCFLSGIALAGFLLWIWSLCRASADADKLMGRIDEREGGLDVTNPPTSWTAITKE